MSEEYDLRKSEKIGQLYPVLVDKHGNVIDGFHRLEANPSWEKKKLEEIDTEEKLLIARAVSNWHRRQVSRQEKEKWINGLAEIYKKQGYQISKKRHLGGFENEIKQKLAEVTGLHPDTVNGYLSSEFKAESRGGWDEATSRLIPASQRIERQLGSDYVKRHREEVERELRPRIEKEVEPKIREELIRDVEFIREVIEKAPDILPSPPKRTIERAKEVIKPKEMGVKEGTIYTVGEYECPHCRKHYLIKCNGRKDWVE